ncbi:MAG: DUF1957 domain-containing protein [Treponema sp.]|nr:DUF1957 domain-containing protein [Treponema sp.]
MSAKKLVLVINANQAYIRNLNSKTEFTNENEVLFSAITKTYIPLLNLFSQLESEGADFKISMVISSQLAELLNDAEIQKQYENFLERAIKLGESEIKRTKGSECSELAKETLENFKKTKSDFTEKYGKNLTKAFASFAAKGLIELIPTAATYAYLPHFSDLEEAVNAQVETGLYAQRQFFGESGDGFFLPFMGFAPGLDRILRSYGMNYTLVDPRTVLFSNNACDTGIFRPVRSPSSLILFPTDSQALKLINGEEGFVENEVYRSEFKDIGYELKAEELKSFLGNSGVRSGTLYRYWKKGGDDPGEETEIYDPEEALEQVTEDAAVFTDSIKEKLSKAAELLPEKTVSDICVIPAELIGEKWHEGIIFLEKVIRSFCKDGEGVELDLCRNLLEDQLTLQKVDPFPSTGDDSGYGENLLDDSNSWMYRYIRKATERMTDLAERLPSETSLKGRLLNLAAKEILLAQSGQWPLMLHEGKLTEYVKDTFKRHILSFTMIFNALASNTVSTDWLTKKEKQDAIYPWMNYRIYSRKK